MQTGVSMNETNGEGNGFETRYETVGETVWLTVPEAARKIGVSPTAIRNRVKRGTLESKPNGNRGVLVRFANGEHNRSQTVPDTVTLTVSKLEAEISALRSENEALRNERDWLRSLFVDRSIGFMPRLKRWIWGL